MKYILIIATMLTLQTANSFGQTVKPGTELQELVRISEIYTSLPNLSFHMYYTFADSLTHWDVVDSMHANCKISYGKTLLTSSEMEMLQGKEYAVFVDKTDSVIIATPLVSDKSIFQMPLLDSVFRAAHVAGMYTYNVNSTTRLLFVDFKPGSSYLSYKIEYDPNTGLVRNVNYHVRNEGGAYGIPTDHIVCATIYMAFYSDAALDPALFNENRYFYKLNGTLYLQQAWQQYHLQN